MTHSIHSMRDAKINTHNIQANTINGVYVFFNRLRTFIFTLFLGIISILPSTNRFAYIYNCVVEKRKTIHFLPCCHFPLFLFLFDVRMRCHFIDSQAITMNWSIAMVDCDEDHVGVHKQLIHKTSWLNLKHHIHTRSNAKYTIFFKRNARHKSI